MRYYLSNRTAIEGLEMTDLLEVSDSTSRCLAYKVRSGGTRWRRARESIKFTRVKGTQWKTGKVGKRISQEEAVMILFGAL